MQIAVVEVGVQEDNLPVRPRSGTLHVTIIMPTTSTVTRAQYSLPYVLLVFSFPSASIAYWGMASSHKPSGSVSGSVDNAPKDARSSIDSERDVESPPPQQNGHSNGDAHPDDTDDPIERLQRELERTKDEKEKLATQYRNLLAKLTQMRTTLGNKLQQDAVCSFQVHICAQFTISIAGRA